MNKVLCLGDFKGEKVDPVVTHHNDEVTLAFYQGENLVLQVRADTFDLLNLPDALLSNMGKKTTEQCKIENTALAFENKELKEQLEQYEEKAQVLMDKYTLETY
jgi:hypothetical protein